MPHAEHPARFVDTLPTGRQALAWYPTLTLTLAFWPCSTSFTVFEVKRCPQTREEAFNVALYTPVEE